MLRGIALLLLAAPALAHDGTNDAWFESLRNGQGFNCCNRHDCAPTDAWRIGPNGYQVALKPGEWSDVPPDRVITDRGNPVGRAVVCIWHGQVQCFVPGASG